MSDDQVLPSSPSQETLTVEELVKRAKTQQAQARKIFDRVLRGIAPWLFEFGSWLFGGLIAFSILLLQAPILLGPVDAAVIICAVAIALALPLDITGLFLLRVVRDAKQFGFDKLMVDSWKDVDLGFPEGEERYLEKLDEGRKKRETVVLYSSIALLFVTCVLTVVAIIAALWHVAWWVGLVFLASILLCGGIICLVTILSQPAETDEDKLRKKQNREMMDKILTRENLQKYRDIAAREIQREKLNKQKKQ